MKSALETKVNIKPIFSNVVHTSIWEGPCRVGTREELDPEYEMRTGLEQAQIWYKNFCKNIDTRYANVLPLAYIEYPESFYISDEKFSVLKEDLNETDIFIFTYRLPGIERLHKPMSMINNGPAPVDLGAYYKEIGEEFYFGHDFEEYNEIIKLLQVRKAIRNTKLLVLTAGEQFPVSVNSSNPDVSGLYFKYGLKSTRKPLKEVFSYMEKVDELALLSDAEALINKSLGSNIKKEWVAKDLKYYEGVKLMMEEFGCNAFTTACKELCATKLPYENKCVPCLTHSLLKDQKMPCSCEEDINVFMAVMIFMYLSRKSVFMGNPSLVHKNKRPIEDLGMTTLLYGPKEGFDHDVLEIRHSVPSLYMQGFDKEKMDYSLGHFTYEGWGTKVQIDMSNVENKTVTIGRFSRDGKRLMVTKAEIIGCAYREIECSPIMYYEVKGGAREFRHALAEHGYGHHLAVVYGDYINELKELSKIVGFTLEVFE